MSAKDGGPAFPVPAEVNPDGYQGGMSLRDWFAGRAISNHAEFRYIADSDSGMQERAKAAHDAYVLADAMLKERAK